MKIYIQYKNNPLFSCLLWLIHWVFFLSVPNKVLWNFNYYAINNLAKQKFYFDYLYNLIFAKLTMIFGYIQYKLIDRGLLELIGPSGFYTTIKYLAIKFRSFHNGYLIHYLIVILYFLIFFILIGF